VHNSLEIQQYLVKAKFHSTCCHILATGRSEPNRRLSRERRSLVDASGAAATRPRPVTASGTPQLFVYHAESSNHEMPAPNHGYFEVRTLSLSIYI